MKEKEAIPLGTQALIFSKYYYGVLAKSLNDLDIERYFSILYYLYFNPDCSQQQICNSMGVNKTAMVKVLAYLKRNGYVASHTSANDRREHVVRLTPKGREQTLLVVEAFNTIDHHMFKQVSKAERTVFIKVLRKLTVSLAGLPAEELFFDYKYQDRRPKRKRSNHD